MTSTASARQPLSGMVELDGVGLTVRQVADVARRGVSVELAGAAREANRMTWSLAARLLRRGVPLYGCNTGVGALAEEAVEATGESELRLLRAHACGVGDVLPADRARALLVVRANQLARGGAGVHPRILDALVAALNAGAAPLVHDTGSLGTGDLTALAEVGLALVGEGRWREDAGPPPAPVRFTPGDAIRLLSSNASTVGQAALGCHDAAVLVRSAEATAALSFVALRADTAVLDERVQRARPHPGQIAAATNLRRLVGTPAGSGRLQDPLCCRCLPQVQGAVRDALTELERVVVIEMNAAAENPLLVPDDGVVLCNGNFHAIRLALVTDQVRAALAQAAAQAAERVSHLLDGDATGLPAFLRDPARARLGAMVVEYPAHDALAELRACATPSTTANAVVCGGVENQASFAALATRQLHRALELFATVVGCELVVAVRALRMADRRPPTDDGQQVFERASDVLPDDPRDRPLTDDLTVAATLLRSGLDVDRS